jgi:hypothetical protein
MSDDAAPPGLSELADELNEALRSAGSQQAELGFGLGCGIGLPLVFIFALALYFLRLLNLIGALILLVVGLMTLVGLASLAAYTARRNAVARVYRQQVAGQVDEYLRAHSLTRQEFDDAVHVLLPLDAPLQAFLSPTPPPPEAADDPEGSTGPASAGK